jgi:hypothetical protein
MKKHIKKIKPSTQLSGGEKTGGGKADCGPLN